MWVRRCLAFLVVAALAAGCLPRVPRQRLETRAPVAVAFVVDPSHAGAPGDAPDALKAQVQAALDEHNLEMTVVPTSAVAAFRLTDSRFAALRAAQPGAPFHVLVELRVQFFSQIDGQYRWEVAGHLTAGRADGQVVRDPFEVPVVLVYDHERQTEALSKAASDVASRLGTLIDGLVAGQKGASPAAAAPAQITPRVAVAAAPAPALVSRRPGSIYFVMVDRFANGDRSNDGDADPADAQAFHGGDLKGLLERLDWIQGLGVDTVWLSPIFAMRTGKWHGFGAFHGYWTWDLSAVEPRFGSEADVKRLSEALHARGMGLVLDVVLNHVGPGAPLQQARPEWFHNQGGLTDWNDAAQLVERDVHGLPDLATEREDVYAHLLAGARRWL